MIENSDFSSEFIKPIHTSKKQWVIFGLIFVILWSIAFFLWFQVEIDKSILFSLNNSNFNENLLLVAQFFSRYGMAVIVFIYLCYLILSLKIESLKDGRQIFLLIIFSFAIAGIAGDILKEIFNRARPIVEYSNEILCFSNPKTPSFPSGHATKSVAFVLPFLFYSEYKSSFHSLVKYILVFTALMVCFARIFLGAHYLSDVIAAIGWVFLSLPISVLFCNIILRKMTYKKLEYAAKKWILIYIGLIIFLITI